MKTFLSAMLISVVLLSSGTVQSRPLPGNFCSQNFKSSLCDSQSSDVWSGRCRTWNLGLNVFGAGISTSVILCCRANNMTMPPFTCFELPQGGGARIGYLLLTDFGPEAQEAFKKEKSLKTITITKSDTNAIDDKQYYIKSGTYDVLENDKKERYLKIILEPAK